MIKTSIGELKLSPLKENGKFVFYNDFITINGKVAKGDKISIFVDGYDQVNGKYMLKPGTIATTVLKVRGEEHTHTDDKGFASMDELYARVSELYKSRFYFSK